MKNRFVLFLSILCFAFNSCKKNNTSSNSSAKEEDKMEEYVAMAEVHQQEQAEAYCAYMGDTLLQGKKELIRFYVEKHEGLRVFESISFPEDSILYEDFEQPHPLKDINGDDKPDTVFVMRSLSPAGSSDSYYFFDRSLPRLFTDSGCCHPTNMFVTDDIDEDGICEIGIFYSSCSSRYKSLRLYTLKNGEWKECGASEFDILTKDPDEVDFSTLVKKTRKNQFKMCNFIEGDTFWETEIIFFDKDENN